MVLSSIQGNTSGYKPVKFGNDEENETSHARDVLLYNEKKKHPITTGAKIQADKFINACTKYPQKGLKGSKNSNFYEFLTMGAVPYVAGSGMLIAVFNLANKFFDTPAAKSASALGKKMGLGVLAYGVAKNVSKKFVETPLNMKYGIDVNLPYKKKIDELPEDGNKDNLVAYEYHKAYESVDFPRWDLFYNGKEFGGERNDYFKSVGKKMGLNDEDLQQADQKVKPLIKEKIVKTKLFSTVSSYLWAASAVGVAMQKPWEKLELNPVQIMKNAKANKQLAQNAKETGKNIAKNSWAKDFGKTLVDSCKEFVNNNSKSTRVAGRALLGSAVLVTAAGIFSTLNDFNNNRGDKTHASSPLFDESKEKVVC